MSIWTTDELAAQIAAYKAALLAVAQGKSYTIGNRAYTYQDQEAIRQTLAYLETEQDKLTSRRGPLLVRSSRAR